MSDTNIETIEKIFEILKERISDEYENKINKCKSRIIKPSDGSIRLKIDCLATAKILSYEVYRDKTVLIGIEYANIQYLIISERKNLDINEIENMFVRKSIQDLIVWEPLYLKALGEKLVPLNDNEDIEIELIDQIFGRPCEQNEDVFYSFKEVYSFFEPMEIWEIIDDDFNIGLKEDILRAYVLFYLKDSQNFNLLEFNEDTRDSLVLLTLNNANRHIIDVVSNAIQANYWNHCFLEMYRCIEKLFHLYYVKCFVEEVMIDKEVAIRGFKKVLMYPNERVTLLRLFSIITKNISKLEELNRIFSEQDSSPCDTSDSKIFEKCASRVYDIRCNIAHLGFDTVPIELSNNKWNNLISCLTYLITELNEIFSDYIYLDS